MKSLLFVLFFYYSCFAEQITDKHVKEFVSLMAKELPIQVNKYFTTLSIIKLDKTITLSNRVTSLKLTQDTLINKKDIFDKEWCSESLLVILKAGYLVENMYYDDKNNLMATNITSYNDCSKILSTKKEEIKIDKTNFNEYCLNDFSILSSKGMRSNITICIAIDKKLNSYIVKDILVQQISNRMTEELLVESGKQLLREDIKHNLNIDTLLITQFSIKNN
jgi:hypothetical protein